MTLLINFINYVTTRSKSIDQIRLLKTSKDIIKKCPKDVIRIENRKIVLKTSDVFPEGFARRSRKGVSSDDEGRDSGRHNWTLQELDDGWCHCPEVPPSGAARCQRAASEALKMAVMYIWSEVCVRDSIPIWRDEGGRCSTRRWHGDRAVVTGPGIDAGPPWASPLMIVPVPAAAGGSNHVQQEASRRRQEVDAQDPGCQEGQRDAVQAPENRARWG